MNILRKKYSAEGDQSAMIQLAVQSQSENLHVIDLPYRLSSWALDESENIAEWVNENGKLVAWAVLQTPFWSIDYVLSPGLSSDLHADILEWADRRVQEVMRTPYGHSSWYVNVFADQTDRRRILEQCGFTSQMDGDENSWSKVWMERAGQFEVPSYPLPAGFYLRPLAGEGEVNEYVDLHRAVFETRNMTAEWRRRTLKQPGYQPELDVVVVSPDGRLVAFCIGWLLKTIDGQQYGQIEPLGCHSDYRSYALGRVALCETLKRLQQLGGQSIFIETDNYRNTAFRLYESVGFRVVRDVVVYCKDYNDCQG
jgi:ribosomal protein S18 acetylase RimI-like enzyme